MPMPGSMLIGRVLLPATGVLLALGLAWQSFPSVLTIETAGGPARDVPSASPATLGSRRECAEAQAVLAEGQVVAQPGAEAVVGAETAGIVARLHVRAKTAVRKGDLLLELRGDDLRAAAEEAVARVNEVDAELGQIERERARLERMPAPAPAQDQTDARDILKARRDTARARRAGAVAGYRRVEAEFARTRLRAPLDGVVVTCSVNLGEAVAPGAPLLRIVDLARLRVEAEVDEFDIARCVPGGAAAISAQAFPGRSWRGSVAEVADLLVARRIRPDDPGRPTDTRVLPVSVTFDEPTPLKLGQRVEVLIRAPRSSPGEDRGAPVISRASGGVGAENLRQ